LPPDVVPAKATTTSEWIHPTDLPVGLFCEIAVQPSLQKYFAFPVGQINFTTRPVPPR
jgi:hypothetical protein